MNQQRERRIFNPDAIEDACKLNLPEALRALADGIENLEIAGSFTRSLTNGWAKGDEAVVFLTLRFAAPLDAQRLESPTLSLPVPGGQQK